MGALAIGLAEPQTTLVIGQLGPQETLVIGQLGLLAVLQTLQVTRLIPLLEVSLVCLLLRGWKVLGTGCLQEQLRRRKQASSKSLPLVLRLQSEKPNRSYTIYNCCKSNY